MRVLVAHNYYQQGGGEDQVFAAEVDLLRANGHQVDTFILRNDAVNEIGTGLLGKAKLAGKTVWNRRAAGDLAIRVLQTKAEVVHFHNTFPLMSPAAYHAARWAGAAVVQTIHNYRLLCPAATFYRDGHVCEDCLGKLPLPAVRHACYRGSRAITAVAAMSLAFHRAIRTYTRQVDAYICLSNFSRGKFLQAGFPADRLLLKPNFVAPDPGVGSGPPTGGTGFALFVGRLCEEKGILPLLSAWRSIPHHIPLRICGDGPLAEQVRTAASELPHVQWLGRQPIERVMQLMGEARCLVFPSVWYEGQPRTIIESLAKGTPVIASDLGAMIEMIQPGESGQLFAPGNAAALASAVQALWSTTSDVYLSMRQSARRQYEQLYQADQNLARLLEIYSAALSRRHGVKTVMPAVPNCG